MLAWMLSPLANRILKTVINHTQNIQSKDFERMPYPWWVRPHDRERIIQSIKVMIADARDGKVWSWQDYEIQQLGELFELRNELGELQPAPDKSASFQREPDPFLRLLI